jgi:hypothetical protein
MFSLINGKLPMQNEECSGLIIANYSFNPSMADAEGEKLCSPRKRSRIFSKV